MAVVDLTLEGLVHDLNNVFQTISESAELLEDDPKWENWRTRCDAAPTAATAWRTAFSKPIARPSSWLRLSKTLRSFARTIWNAPTGRSWNSRPRSMRISPQGRCGRLGTRVRQSVPELRAGRRQEIRIRAHGSEIVVSDDGPGIALELLPRIFQPRVSTKSIISGLGLYVVQSIVEQNGGSVMAANGPTAARFSPWVFNLLPRSIRLIQNLHHVRDPLASAELFHARP
jgi:hypothetical protein